MTDQIAQAQSGNPIAHPGSWTVDPAHSTVGFEVRDMARLVATIRGRFTDYDATLATGSDGEAQAQGAIRVASITTDQHQRDEHLRSAEFLDAGQHPEIRFESDRIEALDAERIRVVGRLELKGVDQPVALEAQVLGTGTDQRGMERLAIAGEGELAFGPMQVKLVIDVSLVKAR